MKKIFLVGIFSMLSCGFFMMLPAQSYALNPAKFEHNYTGTWKLTYYCTDDWSGGNGTIMIDLQKVTTTGKVKDADVYYDNTGTYYPATGKIFKRDGIRRINLNYSTATDQIYKIKAKITPTSIRGKYIHNYEGCAFGGTVKASS
jgi:hypothetical protein